MCGSAIACGVKRLLCKDDQGELAGQAGQPEDVYMDYNTGIMKTRSPTDM